jgi:DNA-binding transcriptional ArsR family regulator
MAASARRDALALDALGNPVRRELLRLLAQKEQPVGELAEKVPVSRPAVSKHLKLLEEAGLVARETRGNRNYCRLEARGFEAAHKFLDGFWEVAMSRLKMHAENTKPRRKRG